jgi:hypothetical protein
VTPADFARCFKLDYEIRVAPLVDHLAGFSLSMATQVTTVAGKVFTALGIKHEFISGALADRTFTALERKENAAAPAHSMLNESVLGQMDGMIRHRTGASTVSNWAIVAGRGAASGAGGGAVDVFINDLMAMDSATAETRGAAKATAAAPELDSQTAAKGGTILAELGRERLRMAAEHEAASVALKQ